MTRIRDSGTLKWETISPRMCSETVSTICDLWTDRRAIQARRNRSRHRNHSGCAMKDRSCIVNTIGIETTSGAEYAGAKNTSGRARMTARASVNCSHRVPLQPGNIRKSNFERGTEIVGACGTNNTNWCPCASGRSAHCDRRPLRYRPTPVGLPQSSRASIPMRTSPDRLLEGLVNRACRMVPIELSRTLSASFGERGSQQVLAQQTFDRHGKSVF